MKNKNILEKGGVLVVVFLISSVVVSTTINTDDFEIEEKSIDFIQDFFPSVNDNCYPQWDKIYHFCGEYDYARFRSINPTSDNGYIIAGVAGVNFVDKNILLVKTDASGNVLFYKDYGGDNHEEAKHVIQTSDGGYIITGWTKSYGEGEEDVYLIKTDSEGTMLWSKTFGTSYIDYGYNVRQTSDNGYIIIGLYNFIPGDEPPSYSDCWLIKTDSQGNLMWDKKYKIPGVDAHNYGAALQITDDGGFIFNICAVVSGSWGFLYLTKTDSAGNIEWSTPIIEIDVNNFGGQRGDESLQITSDNSYILCGNKFSCLGDSEKYPHGYITGNGFIAKVNSDGTLAWTNHLSAAAMSGAFRSVIETPDGDYITIGSQHKKTNIWELWLAKFDSDGNYIWGKVWENDIDDDQEGFGLDIFSNGDYLLGGYKYAIPCGKRFCGFLMRVSKIANFAPNKPDPPDGPTEIKPGVEYSYTVSTMDPEGDNIKYLIYWGIKDGAYENRFTETDWVASGEEVTVTKSWPENPPGEDDGASYIIQVCAIDDSNLESEWSDPKPVNFPKIYGFDAGTLITLPDYTQVSIENIMVGDLVLTCNDDTAMNIARVTDIYSDDIDDSAMNYCIAINENLIVSPKQQLSINGEWKEARHAEIGDVMLKLNGYRVIWEIIRSIEYDYSNRIVYRLELQGEVNSYFANEIIVRQ